MSGERILVVDDEREILISCFKILRDRGYDVSTCTDGSEALTLLRERSFDLLLVDLKMPGKDGLQILEAAKQVNRDGEVVIFTGYATIESAVAAIKKGAFDYVEKPFTADQLSIVVEKALEHRRLVQENVHLRMQMAETYCFENIVGQSPQMQLVIEMARKVARTDANILLTGESGTGKELLTRAIHCNSHRSTGPLVPIDCAALPETLLESELFGYEKGAFTDAHKTKRGLLELAHQGTVFLDEIGELSPALQAKLLRTLQEREFRRLGGEKLISVDIRIISSTNRDLKEWVAGGRFREDLYFRLKVIEISLPPLRARTGDVPLLANHFLKKYSHQYQRPVRELAPEAVAALEAYSWPGNVRELENTLERAVALAGHEVLHLDDLPDYIGHGPRVSPMESWSEIVSLHSVRRKSAEAMEKPYLIQLLRRHKGNVSEVAKEAGTNRKMIYRLAKRFAIDIDSFRD
ncbi:MAG: sigma-54-dependent Fis family transcriptional regulator [Acidobacteria bacterium]|nr:sigma-54-dependent Fis family transcriptional regulator [Acidobacteriota bacterium]